MGAHSFLGCSSELDLKGETWACLLLVPRPQAHDVQHERSLTSIHTASCTPLSHLNHLHGCLLHNILKATLPPNPSPTSERATCTLRRLARPCARFGARGAQREGRERSATERYIAITVSSTVADAVVDRSQYTSPSPQPRSLLLPSSTTCSRAHRSIILGSWSFE